MKINARKILTITALACTALVAVMLLLSLFDVIELFNNDEKTLPCVFWSLVVVGISCFVLIAPVDLLKRTKVLPFINIGLTLAAAVLFLIAVWTEGSIFLDSESEEGGLMRFTIALSIVAVTFTIICSRVQKLGKYVFPLQLVVYALLAAAAVFLLLLLYGVIDEVSGNLLKFIIADLVLGFAGLIALAVLAKRNPNSEQQPQVEAQYIPTQQAYQQPNMQSQYQQSFDDQQYITIKRSEYDGMKRYIAALEEELARRRQG